jgi:hypothetical protein
MLSEFLQSNDDVQSHNREALEQVSIDYGARPMALAEHGIAW